MGATRSHLCLSVMTLVVFTSCLQSIRASSLSLSVPPHTSISCHSTPPSRVSLFFPTPHTPLCFPHASRFPLGSASVWTPDLFSTFFPLILFLSLPTTSLRLPPSCINSFYFLLISILFDVGKARSISLYRSGSSSVWDTAAVRELPTWRGEQPQSEWFLPIKCGIQFDGTLSCWYAWGAQAPRRADSRSTLKWKTEEKRERAHEPPMSDSLSIPLQVIWGGRGKEHKDSGRWNGATLFREAALRGIILSKGTVSDLLLLQLSAGISGR